MRFVARIRLLFIPFTVVSAAATLTGVLFAASPQKARAQNLFVSTRFGNFGTLNVTTAAYTNIATTTYNGTTIIFGGLANAANGNLYGLENTYFTAYGGPARLFQVDRTSGALSLVGGVSAFGNIGDRAYEGLGNTSDGTLYAYYTPRFGLTNNSLYTLDASSAIATQVGTGDTGAKFNGGINGDGSGNLFATGGNLNSVNSENYRFDRTTGAAQTLTINAGAGSTFALGFTGNTLYALNNGGGIYTIDMSSGAATSTGRTYSTSGIGAIFGAASVSPFSMPEPGTLFLLGLGLVSGAGWVGTVRYRKAKPCA